MIQTGVSVSSGLLNLDISAENISQEELLDILKSYRSKKKYYRLKNGDFMGLEDDTLKMLDEMMSVMHLSPKEFIKGRIQLPLYRTLYLDKMLEENENIYSERDEYFCNLVREYKTVNDSDFELPQSLKTVMRNYQKKGYRWLRTLENCGFGGILADDMGLGKTLQAIAVLAAARTEGREGTSLVVAPASLVFNWGEELKRFAPELEVCLLTGTREDRKQKIEQYQSFDVLVTSYDLQKRDASFYEGKEFLYQIIDEAQYIKNHTTSAAKRPLRRSA
ncbi:MAG: DEAD/DEAH box helicase family protein [Dorea sp.]|nr:DEAD/DEAH box helicase family protein [Dorea sp.]